MYPRPHSLQTAGSDLPPRKAQGSRDKDASLREVLACVDRSELARGVLPHAQLVARALGARLTLLHVLEGEPGAAGAPVDPLSWGIRRREAQAELHDLAAQVPELEGGLRRELIQGRAAEQICRWARDRKIGLTVLCSHGASGVTEWDLASTARKLIDRLPGSLLLIPACASAAGQEVHYRRILIPVDGSARAESVVPMALRIAGAEQAEVLFAHVVPAPEITAAGPLDQEGVELRRRLIDHNHRVAIEYLDRLRARATQSGVRIRVLAARDASVRAGLQRLIRDERADLVVMAAHGHGGGSDTACGSVTEHAVTHATTPLLIVREHTPRRARRVTSAAARPVERLATPGPAFAL